MTRHVSVFRGGTFAASTSPVLIRVIKASEFVKNFTMFLAKPGTVPVKVHRSGGRLPDSSAAARLSVVK